MKYLILSLVLLTSSTLFSQDSLPNFSATVIAKNKAVVSWKNQFGVGCTQISVQRSYDSLRGFKTIFSSLSPELPENGYVDNDYLTGLKNYYRIFYVLEDGRYFFTKSMNAKLALDAKINSPLEEKTKEEVKDKIKKKKDLVKLKTELLLTKEQKLLEKKYLEIIQKRIEDSLIKVYDDSIASIPVIKYYSIYKRKQKKMFLYLEETDYKKFKDSISLNTKDTLVELAEEKVILNNYLPPAWKPSNLVFTNNRGYVELKFDDYKTHKYKVIFYNNNYKQLFTIKQVTNSTLSFDKSNFMKAGWYFFEVYDTDKLVEKNKFLLESEL